jgi:hypothetical protein
MREILVKVSGHIAYRKSTFFPRTSVPSKAFKMRCVLEYRWYQQGRLAEAAVYVPFSGVEVFMFSLVLRVCDK